MIGSLFKTGSSSKTKVAKYEVQSAYSIDMAVEGVFDDRCEILNRESFMSINSSRASFRPTQNDTLPSLDSNLNFSLVD